MKRYLYDFSNVADKYYPPPCYRISKLGVAANFYPYNEEGIKNFVDLWIVTILYENHWMKIIQQSKEVDVHSLIGNIGGNLGLFVGFSVLGGLFSIFDFIASHVCKNM